MNWGSISSVALGICFRAPDVWKLPWNWLDKYGTGSTWTSPAFAEVFMGMGEPLNNYAARLTDTEDHGNMRILQ